MSLIFALGLLTACNGGPDYPSLMPTDDLLREPDLPAHAGAPTESPEAALTARADALRARAEALSGPVIEQDSPILAPRRGAHGGPHGGS